MTERRRKRRGNRIRGAAEKVIMICLAGIIAVSAYNIFKIVKGYMDGRNTYAKAGKAAAVDVNKFTGVIDFDALEKINPDIQAWLYQKNTVINYPVVKGKDNNKYLHTMFDGKYGVCGTLFMDAASGDDFADFNTVIYGHHMRDGSMFRSLRGYTKEKGYYDNHKRFELITKTGKYHLVVFSAYITPSDSDTYRARPADERDKAKYIDMVKRSSEIKADDIDVNEKDRTVTLSTCAYDYDEARYVVICKMIPWSDKEIKEGVELQKKIDKSD